MRTLTFIALAILLAGCKVGPNYQRPSIPLPAAYRDAQPGSTALSLSDTKWPQVFGDETLTGLVNTALKNNFDLKIAAERVTEARASLGVTRANQYPFLDAQANVTSNRGSTIGSVTFLPKGAKLNYTYTQVGAALSWELDLFGRLRRLTEAAQAQYLASEEGRRGVVVSLISDVTTNYLQIREYELELEVGQNTQKAAEDSLRLTKLRRERGASSGLDVSQSEQLLYTATAQIESVRRSMEQSENALSVLLGEAPAAQPKGTRLDKIPVPAQVPAGLPSDLLARRPDIRQAEQNLIAANAQIGAAKALYFPQISLTAFAGGQSRALSEIASNPARSLNVSPALTEPIFHAGQIRNQIRLSESQKRELVVTYQKTVYTALREVSDALVGYQRYQSQRGEQERLVGALDNSVRLSNLRYKGGIDSYLQVLDAERNDFSGQLVLAQLRLQERLAVVQLYRALGGGWQ
jgi:multidrug efflux system outer membrane protein